MKHFLFITFLFVFNLCIQAQEVPITIGTAHTINSEVLEQNREIQVYLPTSYSTSDQNYPVLYLLDGQRFFANGVAIQKSLRSPIALPEMIVVGINSTRSSRRPLFGEGKKFTSFLKDDLIHFIDSNYRTSDERIIFGWEAAAYYISEMILEENNLFSGAIITDGGNASEELVKGFKSDKEIYLYMANSRKDIFYIASTDTFNELLKTHNPENLIWTYELFNEEVHQSMPHLALYKGLKYFYHNYDSPVFESIQHFKDMGGMEYITSYFKKRAKRFGGDGSIDDKTKNGLIWLTWNRDDFEHFNYFMTEFKDVLKTKRYDTAYWQNRFGQFYLKHKDYKNAIKYFEFGLKNYPNSTQLNEMQQGLEDSYTAKKDGNRR